MSLNGSGGDVHRASELTPAGSERIDEVLGVYPVLADREAEFCRALVTSLETCARLGFLAGPAPTTALRSRFGPLLYVQVTRWHSAGLEAAHVHPEVIFAWTRVREYVSAVATGPLAMAFPTFREVSLRPLN